MSKKIEPTEYLDEDYLFLILQLVDHPKLKRDKITFNEIKTEKYKYSIVSDVFYRIAILNKQDLLKIEELKFNIFSANKNDLKIIKTLILAMKKYPEQKLSQAAEKITSNNFNFHDLEIVLPYKCSPHIFNLIDFDIKISKESKQIIINGLKKYLKLFASGKLESKTKNYPRVEIQKENIKEKINEMSVRFGSILALKDSDFDSEYRFFENILLLEKEKFLITKNISSEEVNKNSVVYLIHCELKENCDFRPYCKIKNDIGFLKFSQDGEAIKIGGIDSRHFKLLKLLLKPIGIARSINHAFEYIETNKGSKDSGINDPYLKPAEQIRILENAKKEMQKGNKIKGRIKIRIDKMRKTIWA